jgi:hypothetical protein
MITEILAYISVGLFCLSWVIVIIIDLGKKLAAKLAEQKNNHLEVME